VYIDLDDKTLNYGIHGEGETVEEALTDFKASYADMKALYKEEGKPFVEATFEFLYDLPSFLQHYSNVFSYAGLSRLTGVNQSQLSQYVQGYRKPTKRTSMKIQEKLHSLSQELRQIQFV
ncbi:MAG: DNA-binding protein, partial [Capnocytophaga endodontalis]